MKPISIPTFKTVDYYGIQVTIHSDYKYLATDSLGFLHAYDHKPIAIPLGDGSRGAWGVDPRKKHGDYVYIGDVDLEGEDWRETLRKV